MSETNTRTLLKYGPAETLNICIERLQAREAKLTGYLDKYGAELAVITSELASYRAAAAALNGTQPVLTLKDGDALAAAP